MWLIVFAAVLAVVLYVAFRLAPVGWRTMAMTGWASVVAALFELWAWLGPVLDAALSDPSAQALLSQFLPPQFVGLLITVLLQVFRAMRKATTGPAQKPGDNFTGA